jgi:hypothetical protein
MDPVPVVRSTGFCTIRAVLRRLSLLGLGLLIAACSGGAGVTAGRSDPFATTAPPDTPATTTPRPPTTRPPAAETTTTSTSTTVATPLPAATDPPLPTLAYIPAVWPPYVPLPGVTGVAALTNLAVDPGLENVSALAVKVDNHQRARPQAALSWADVIVEENVESLTRFIAVFHSRLPPAIGPIRSARTSDLPILAALNRPVLVWSGGNANVTAEVRSAADSGVLVDVSAFSRGQCFSRASERRAPHNLYVRAQCALDAAPSAGPARPAWSFDDLYVAAGIASGRFDVRMDGVNVVWAWDPSTGTYLREQDGRPHVAADGVQIAATNVVVMSVAYLPSRADSRSPEAQTVGAGNVVVHRDGVAVAGMWSRPSPTDPFVFTDTAGTPIPLASGTTFIELPRS